MNRAALSRDAWAVYLRIARTGSRAADVVDRLTLGPSRAVREHARALEAAGLLRVDDEALELPPIPVELLPEDAALAAEAAAARQYWADWRPGLDDGAVLHGGKGYFEHWATVRQAWNEPGPMTMDIAMPATRDFWDRSWLEFIDRDLHRGEIGAARLAVRLITPNRSEGADAADLAEMLRGIGAEVRMLDVPDWYTVYGSGFVVVPEDADRVSGYSRLVRLPAVTRAFRALFDRQWAEAAPVRPASTDVESQVLALLADGAQDAEIAERLGIAERSVRRHVAAASERTRSRTRFQLGGWWARQR